MNDNWRTYATICRLCLQKDGYMLGIFNHIRGKDKSIYKKIIDCTALQISQGDGLPNVICHRCLYKIEFCLEFRKLCFVSDATLRQLNGALTANDQAAPGGAAATTTTTPSTANPTNTPTTANNSQLPYFEQLANGDGEDVVMVVDPYALDYESEYEEPEPEKQPTSDVETNETNDTFGGKSVSMCKYCDHAFTDANECADHETNAHNCDVPYVCSLCKMSFADRLQYSAHLKGVHQNDKPYNCPQCDRTFARRSDLRKHTVVHTGIKPFTCTVCSKSFSRNTNLSKHMRIHSGRKPFVCPKCPKTFFSKGDLTRHSLIHSGQKPFSCKFCFLSFGRKDKLLRHEKRHAAQKGPAEKLQENLDNYACYNNGKDSLDDHKKDTESENMVISLDPFNHNNYGDGIKNETEPVEPSEVPDNLESNCNNSNEFIENMMMNDDKHYDSISTKNYTHLDSMR